MTKINPEGAESSSVSAEALIGVESFAIAHYMKESEEKWLCALHAENFTFSMLFALLMWDIIFLRVPDVFRALFQVGVLYQGSKLYLLVIIGSMMLMVIS